MFYKEGTCLRVCGLRVRGSRLPSFVGVSGASPDGGWREGLRIMRPVRVNFSAGRLERGMPMTVSYVGSGTVRRKTERRSLNRQSRKTGTMNTKAEIQTMLAAYTARYPDERAAMEPFVRYVASFDAPALYDRKNFVGHLTAGALIVSRQTGCVLLLKHKQLGKWLQPAAMWKPPTVRCSMPLSGRRARRRDRSGTAGAALRRAAPCLPGSGRCGRALHSALPEQGRGRTSAFRHALRFPGSTAILGS